MKTALVTGGTGFVGSVLVEELAKSGVSVTVAGRGLPPERVSAVGRHLFRPHGGVGLKPDLQGVAGFVEFDLERVGDLSTRCFADVDVVYHLAARVHVMRQSASDAERFHTLNAVATEKLARKAAAGGARRFVFLSSVKVNGERTVDQPFKSTDTPAPQDPYGASKAAAEDALRRVSADTGLEVVIVRPPLVYGPGVGANFQRLLSFVQRRVPLPLGSVDNRRSLVSVWNLVDLLRVVGDHPLAAGTWLVSDGDDLSTPRLLRLVGGCMGIPAQVFKVPVSMLTFAARLLGKDAEVRRLVDSLQVDIAPTVNALGWNPPLSVEEGMRRTVEAYMRSRSVAV